MPNEIELTIGGERIDLPHLSKGDGISLKAGDCVQVRTPGGGGYGPGSEREVELRMLDVRRGYLRGDENGNA